MRFEDFYAERQRVVREVTDLDEFAREVDRLRELADSVDDDPDRARRYVEATEFMLAEASMPRSELADRAFAAMRRARAVPDGTPDEQRAHVKAGMAEIETIAAEATSPGEEAAVRRMNETLQRALWRIDAAERGVDDLDLP